MTKARLDGLYLLLLGCVAFILLGTALVIVSPHSMIDFKTPYYGTRCLLQHGDPYKQLDVLRTIRENGGERPTDSVNERRDMQRFVYLPTLFPFMLPFAMLAFGPAQILWMALIIGGLILASFLMWSQGATDAPVVSGAFIGFLLVNSILIVMIGNPAGIAISFCVVAVWCFLHDRFVRIGILLLALSLAIKPHDTGFVWLYFLLAGGVNRKRALQTLAVAAALSLPVILWVTYVSPNWMQELHSTLMATSVRGGPDDPGPASTGGHGLGMMINLQTAISVLRDDPRIYNPATYLICGALLAVWSVTTLRSRFTLVRAELALAAIAALTLLPIYHRQNDAKLLLLTVPACAMLWAEGGLIGRLALLVNSAGLVLTGDLPWAFLLALIGKLHLSTNGLTGQIVTAVQVFPAPLVLLVMSIFYLWIYVRRCPAWGRGQDSSSVGESGLRVS